MLGSYLAMTLPVAIVGLRPRSGRPRRLLNMIAVVLQVATLVATVNRGAWVAAAVALIMVFAVAPTSPLRRPSRATLALLLVVAAILICVLALELRPDPRTGHTRLLLWRETAGVVLGRPLLGYGQETYPAVFTPRQSQELRRLVGSNTLLDHAHNLWLDTAFEVGILGMLALTAILVVAIMHAWRIARAPDEALPRRIPAVLAGALVAYAIEGLFMFPTIVPSTFCWLLTGAVLALPYPSGEPPAGDDRAPRRGDRGPVRLKLRLLGCTFEDVQEVAWRHDLCAFVAVQRQ